MGDCFRTAEVYVRGFPAHVVEQPGLVLFLSEEENTHRLEKRSAFLGTNPDELEKNLIRAEVCGGEGMRSCFAMASVRGSAVCAGQRCSGRLLAIDKSGEEIRQGWPLSAPIRLQLKLITPEHEPETFRAFPSFL